MAVAVRVWSECTARRKAVPFCFGGHFYVNNCYVSHCYVNHRYVNHRFIEALSRTTEWSNIYRESGIVMAQLPSWARLGRAECPSPHKPFLHKPSLHNLSSHETRRL